MSEQKQSTVSFTIVAFRYDQKNSVLYVTRETVPEVELAVRIALVGRNADVISIRRVYECQPIPQNQTS